MEAAHVARAAFTFSISTSSLQSVHQTRELDEKAPRITYCSSAATFTRGKYESRSSSVKAVSLTSAYEEGTASM